MKCAAADPGDAVLCHEPADGPDADPDPDVLLGQPAWHAGGHRGLCERGHAAGALDSLSEIVSPPLLASFAALAVFPWIARATVGILRRRRVYAGWTRPRRFDRNLVVIGAGSAGLVSAYIAAATKAKVTLIEAGAMGGDCLNHGCVPSRR